MRKQNLISAVIAALTFVSGTCAYALECSPSSYIEDSKQWIRLEIEGDHAFEEIAVRIVKPGAVITNDMSFEDYKNHIIAMTTVTTDQNKKARKEVRVSDDIEEGIYTIDLVSAQGHKTSKSYKIISSSKVLEKFNVICTSASLTEVKDAIEAYGEDIGLEVTQFCSLSEEMKENTVKTYIKNRDKLKAPEHTVQEAQRLLDEALMVSIMKNTEEPDLKTVFEQYENILKLKETEFYVKYMGFTGVEPVLLYKRIVLVQDEYTSIEELRESAQTQILLYAIEKGGSWYNTRDIVKSHYERLGLTKSDIDLDESIESDVYKIINGKAFKDAQDFTAGFHSAVLQAKKENGNTKPNKNSGGGGGGSNSQRPIAPIPKDETTPSQNENGKPETNEPASLFPDVKQYTPWAEEAVSELHKKGILNGRNDDEFSPNDFVTREEFTKMIVLMAGYDTSTQDEKIIFEDTDMDAWYYPYVYTAYEKGLVKGKTQTKFGIGENITRQEMAVLIYRTVRGDSGGSSASFSDFDRCDDYAKNAVSYLQYHNIVKGRENNRFEPLETATRAEAAQMIYRAMQSADDSE